MTGHRKSPRPSADTLDQRDYATLASFRRSLRIFLAFSEAAARAPSSLGRSACELRVSTDPRGVRIDVDVQAPLIERSGARKHADTRPT